MRYYTLTLVWKKAVYINLINILMNTYKNLINKHLTALVHLILNYKVKVGKKVLYIF